MIVNRYINCKVDSFWLCEWEFTDVLLTHFDSLIKQH